MWREEKGPNCICLFSLNVESRKRDIIVSVCALSDNCKLNYKDSNFSFTLLQKVSPNTSEIQNLIPKTLNLLHVL